MKLLRDTIGRHMLVPALRLLRAQLSHIADPVQLREAAARFDALGHLPPGVRTEAVQAGNAPATWVHTKGAKRDRVLLYLHGGAFIAETPIFHGSLLARLCHEARAQGLMLSYRLAPEHPYPAALDDCVAAYQWLLAQGFAPEHILIAGDSAGGNLTLALLLRLRDERLPLPCGAVTLSPVTDFTFSGDSMARNNGIDDMFSAEAVDALVPVYLPSRDLCRHPHVSPVFGDYTGLPPLLLVAGSTELLLDDSVRVAQRWPQAELLVWHGMPHVFAGFDFLPEAHEAQKRIGAFMRACLNPGSRSAQAGPETDDADALPAGVATQHSTPQRKSKSATVPATRLYLALLALTAIISLAFIVMGRGPALLWANPITWAGTATASVYMLMRPRPVGAWRAPLCVALSALLGPGCGLALFLYWRARHGVQRA